jgi:hypothetical protein
MRPDRRPEDGPSSIEEAWKTINSILEECFGEQIESIVSQAEEPTLRPKLKLLFFERTRLQIAIEEAKDLTALESAIDESADTLDKRIRMYHKQLALAAEIKKAETRKEFAARNLEALHLLKELKESSLPDRHADPTESRIVTEALEAAERATEQALRVSSQVVSTSEKVEDILLHVDRQMLTKNLARFRRRQTKRKWLRHLYGFFWAVLIVGVLISSVLSTVPRLFLVDYWWLGLVAVGGAIIKHYWLSPWLRRRVLETQRKHLFKSLNDFYAANMQVTVLVALKEKRIERKRQTKRIKPRKK